MARTKSLAINRERAFIIILSIAELATQLVNFRNVGQYVGDNNSIRTQDAFADHECALKERLRRIGFPHYGAQRRQRCKCRHDGDVVRAKPLLVDFQHFRCISASLLELALRNRKPCQVGVTVGHAGMVRSKCGLPNSEGATKKPISLNVAALPPIERTEIEQTVRNRRIAGLESRFANG